MAVRTFERHLHRARVSDYVCGIAVSALFLAGSGLVFDRWRRRRRPAATEEVSTEQAITEHSAAPPALSVTAQGKRQRPYEALLFDQLPVGLYQVDLADDLHRIIYSNPYLSTILNHDRDLVGAPHSAICELLSLPRKQLTLLELAAEAGTNSVLDVPGVNEAEERIFEVFVVGKIEDTAVIMVRDITGSHEYKFRAAIKPIAARVLTAASRIHTYYDELAILAGVTTQLWQAVKPEGQSAHSDGLTRQWTQQELDPIIKRLAAYASLSCAGNPTGKTDRKLRPEEIREARMLLGLDPDGGADKFSICFSELAQVVLDEASELRDLLSGLDQLAENRDRDRYQRLAQT